MKLRLLLPCLALAITTTIAAHAQAGIYIDPIAVRVSNSQKDTGPFAFLGDNNTSRFFYGVTIGGYYDIVKGKRATVGVDIRDTLVHGNSAALNSFLIGVRVAGLPETSRFKPYLQISAGAASSKPPTSYARLNRATVQGYAGIDYSLAKYLDFRAVEVGYGTAQTISSANFGGAIAYPSSSLLSFSSGFVIRIP